MILKNKNGKNKHIYKLFEFNNWARIYDMPRYYRPLSCFIYRLYLHMGHVKILHTLLYMVFTYLGYDPLHQSHG